MRSWLVMDMLFGAVLSVGCGEGGKASPVAGDVSRDVDAPSSTPTAHVPSAATHVPSATTHVPSATATNVPTATSTQDTTTGNGTLVATREVSTSVAPAEPASTFATSSSGPDTPSGVSDTAVTPAPSPPGSLGTFTCPAPPYAATPLEGGATVEAVAGVPPADGFAGDSDTTILEGPVWLGEALYISQINNGTPFFGPRPGQTEVDAGAMSEVSREPPPSRILRVTPAGEVSVALENTGSNGLAVDSQGLLVGASHGLGAIVRFSLTGEPHASLVSSYESMRLNSPNDLTFGLDGTLYFTDPDYQAPTPVPQADTRVYSVAPNTATAVAVIENRSQPNGITFSPNRNTLYVSASDGIFAYPVSSDGTLGAGSAFAPDVLRSSDGMAVDCAGNLYTTAGQRVTIVSPTGQQVGVVDVSGVQSVTNVAFGDADHQTMYVTTLGAGTRVGLFKVRTAIPGMPY